MPLAIWSYPELGTDPAHLPGPAYVSPLADARYSAAIVVYGDRTSEPYNFHLREMVWPNAGLGPSRVPFTLATAQAGELDYQLGREPGEVGYALRPITATPTAANRRLQVEQDLQSDRGPQPYQARVHEPSYGPSGYVFP